MPFEITHLVVGQQLGFVMDSGFVAGLLYPDVRYPFGIDRDLTHVEVTTVQLDSDFNLGWWLHLRTDEVWNDCYKDLRLKNLWEKEGVDDFMVYGATKLVNDLVVGNLLEDRQEIIASLKDYEWVGKRQATLDEWRGWVEMLSQYIKEGPTKKGLKEFVLKMRYADEEVIDKGMVLFEAMKEKYTQEVMVLHDRVVCLLKKEIDEKGLLHA